MCSLVQENMLIAYIYLAHLSNETLRGQTVHWIGAQFCVCLFLDSRDKSLNMFQNVSGFRVQIAVT